MKLDLYKKWYDYEKVIRIHQKKSEHPTYSHARAMFVNMCAHNIFLIVHNLGVGKKMKVGQGDPMDTHGDFRTSTDSRARAAVKSVKRASIVTLVTDILSKKLKKWTPLI